MDYGIVMCVKNRWILVADWDILVVKHIYTENNLAMLLKIMKLLNQKLMKKIIYLIKFLKIVETNISIHLNTDVFMILDL